MDTIILSDLPITGNETVRYAYYPAQLQEMNDSLISVRDYDSYYCSEIPTELYVLKNISHTLNELPDGHYYLNVENVIIDTNGTIVFYSDDRDLIYDPNSIIKYLDVDYYRPLTDKPGMKAITLKIAREVDELLYNAPPMIPGIELGHKVITHTSIDLWKYSIEVKNHRSTYTYSGK